MAKRTILLAAAIGLVASLGFASPTITVDTVILEPNAEATINVRYSGVDNGLKAIQVGPEGALTYDPGAVEVVSINAVEPFIFLYREDDGNGNIRFALVSTDQASPSGTLLQLTVKAIGPTGQDTQMVVTKVDDAVDGNDASIPPGDWQLQPGWIKINTPPVADFSWTAAGTEVQFTNNASDEDGFITSYSWDFGDGTPLSSEPNPTHRYASPGSYVVTLVVTDDDGVSSSTSKQVDVGNASPVVDFHWVPQQPTTSDNIQFVSDAYDPDGSIVAYHWDFGDGATSTERNPVHRYAVPGEYTVTLRCTDDRGATSEKNHSIQVSNTPPTACFTYSPEAPTTETPVHFHDCSQDPDGTIVAWEWDFGDGHTSGEQNPVHTYTANGTYTVTLTVTDNNGGKDTVSHQISVGNQPPNARFRWSPSSPKAGEEVRFEDESSDPDGQITAWLWEFGDGTASTQQNPVHVYAQSGTYTVRLTVTDDDGATDTYEAHITIQNTPPVVDFDWSPDNPLYGETVQFVDASHDPDGQVVSWLWDFGDGTTSTEQNPTHVYSSPGTYTVSLRVTDDKGATASKQAAIKVIGVKADFKWDPSEPIAMEVVQFTDLSVSADGPITSWSWDFGDGAKSAKQNPTHAYEEDGTYNVRLTVNTKTGARDSIVYQITVKNAPPIPDFTFSPAQPRIGEEVEFNASGTVDPDGDEIISYQWDFNGDGTVDATGIKVSHVFATNGAKEVTLYVTDADGARASITKTVPIEVNAPVAQFTYTPQYPAIGEVVTFDASESYDPDGTIEFYEWDFNGDGEIDRTGKVVTWAFTQGGTNYVTLKVTDNDGVVGSLTKGVHVRLNSPPVADFSFSPEQPAVGEEVTFTDQSEDPDGEIVAWNWDFGDGATSEEQNPTHVFTSLGAYDVTLTVTDDKGASDSITKTITVANSPPTADFDWDPPHPAAKQPITFTATASDPDPGDQVVSYAWDFGDGTTGEGEEVVHMYQNAGSYSVTLTVTDTHGAEAQVTKEVSVGTNSPPRIISLLVSPPTPEAKAEVEFRVEANDPEGDEITGWQWDFGDGTTSSQAPPVTHTYQKEGIYTVRVRAKDAGSGKWSPWFEEELYVRHPGGPEIGAYVEQNPVSTRAEIVYFLPEGSTNAKLLIFDLLGRPVFEHDLTGNRYSWDLKTSGGADVPSGVYFFVITAEKDGRTIRSDVGRILVVRRGG